VKALIIDTFIRHEDRWQA